METLAIPISALVISLTTLVLTGLSLSRSARVDRVQTLERRVEELDARVLDCERDRAELHDENLRLMRQIMAGGPPRA